MSEMRPSRAYTDWWRAAPEVEEAYRGDQDWHFYYRDTDWEEFLNYLMVLDNKGYRAEGGRPQWLQVYLDEMIVQPFACHEDTISIVMHKPDWIRNTLTYHLQSQTAPAGMSFRLESKIEPQPGFLAGNEAVGCPREAWEPYTLKREENLRNGTSWCPIKS